MIVGKNNNTFKKVLIYGNDGTGKSYFAEEYCQDYNLKSVVFDFDKTNFESENIIQDFKLEKNVEDTYKSLKSLIRTVEKSEEYNTIIFDGISTLLENLTGEGKGQYKFLVRSEYWKKIRNLLLRSDLNLIFVGQIDLEIKYFDDDGKPIKPANWLVRLHSIVNEKYFCDFKEGVFSRTILKYRNNSDLVGEDYSILKKTKREVKKNNKSEFRNMSGREQAIAATETITEEEQKKSFGNELYFEELIQEYCEKLYENQKPITKGRIIVCIRKSDLSYEDKKKFMEYLRYNWRK